MSQPVLTKPLSPFASPVVRWGLLLLGAIAAALWQAGIFRQSLFNPGGWEQFQRFAIASLHPALSAEIVRLTWEATFKTLAYAVCGTALALVLGFIGGIFCSEVWWSSVYPQRGDGRLPLSWVGIRGLLAVPRAIHEVIWGLLFVRLFGLDPLVGVLAIALPFGAITAKVFAELLDETPRQPLHNLLNSGVAPASAFLYGLLPQALLNLVSYAFYRFECSIRSSALLGFIGAGGLGNEIRISLESLRYEELWTFFYALIVLNGCVDFTSSWLRHRWGCTSRLDLNLARKSQPISQRRPLQQTRSSRQENPLVAGWPIALFVGLCGLCFWSIQADFTKLWSPRTGQRLQEIARACWPPDVSLLPQLPGLAVDTVAMSILAIALAAMGGTVLSFLAAQNFFLPGGILNRNPCGNKVGAWAGVVASRLILLMCRAIPAPVWALVILYLVFPGILPGAIALGIHNLGILGRLQAEVVENLDVRPLEALKAQGTPASLVFLYGVLPLTLPRFLAYGFYRWEVCMRETVIVGLVGAGGLGRLLTEQLSSFDYQGLVVTLTGFVLLTFAVDWLSQVARRSLR